MAEVDEVNDHVRNIDYNQFWDSREPIVPESFKQLIRKEGPATDEEILERVRQIVGLDPVVRHAPSGLADSFLLQRDEAWAVIPYPCIGLYMFLQTPIASHSRYAEVIDRCRNGQTLLDVGVGIGQDLRRLAYDGAPVDNLYATDLNSHLWEVGFKLFRDHDSFRAAFSPGDFLSANLPDVLGRERFDMIWFSEIFHLFPYEQQIEIFCRSLEMLKMKPGSLIFGRQVAVREPIEMPTTSGPIGNNAYLHTGDSFMKWVDDIEARSGVSFTRSVEVHSTTSRGLQDTKWQWRLSFALQIQEAPRSTL